MKITPDKNLAFVDTNNSSTAPLLAGQTFTGVATYILQHANMSLSVISDQASATKGLRVEQSTDGINWDFNDAFTIPANTGKNFTLPCFVTWVRVVYKNGAVDQTEFRLTLIIKPHNMKHSSHTSSEPVTSEDDCTLNKSIIMTKANDLDVYEDVALVNPLPVNGDQLYPHDVNLTYSNMYSFDGSAIDLLNNRWSTITDSTANNPKAILLEFERPIQTPLLGIFTYTGTFSNCVLKYGLANEPDIILVDESGDATPKQQLIAPLSPVNLSRLIIEFHTTNPVSLSEVNVAKARQSLSQIQGIDPDGLLKTFSSTRQGNLKISIQEYGDTPSIDSFGRLRISDPETLFDAKQLHDKQPLFWDESLGGSATSIFGEANTIMSVSASASDFVIRQTKQRFNYQPGKAQLVMMTFYAPSSTGVNQRIGLFDGTGANYLTPNNGIYFENDGGTLYFKIAKNGSVTESYEQSQWNVDTFDGYGHSKLNFETNSTHILVCDFEWLGVGRVRIGWCVGGIIHYCHYFEHANITDFIDVYMLTPNLPLRYDITSNGSNAGVLKHICSTVISEGGQQQTGILRSINRGSTHLNADVAGTPYASIIIRLKSAYTDITVVPEYFSMIATTNDDFLWQLHLNPTISGSLTYSNLTDSAIQYALGVTANAITDPGLVIDSGYSRAEGGPDRRFLTALKLGATITGNLDILALSCMPMGSNADILSSLSVRELL